MRMLLIVMLAYGCSDSKKFHSKILIK